MVNKKTSWPEINVKSVRKTILFIYLDLFTPSSVRIILFHSSVCFVLSHFWAPPSLSNVRLMSTAPPRTDLTWGPSNIHRTWRREKWDTGDPPLSSRKENLDRIHYRYHFTALIICHSVWSSPHSVLWRTGWWPLVRPEVGDQLSSKLSQLWEAILRQRPGPPWLPGYHSILETRPKLSGLKQPQPDHNIHRGDF